MVTSEDTGSCRGKATSTCLPVMSSFPFGQQQVGVARPGCHHFLMAFGQVKVLVLIGTTG